MKRRRRKKYTWSDSLPDDMWTDEPKVHLYRLQHPGKPRYLGIYLAFLVDEAFVASYYGGGDYLFIASHRGRVVRRGVFSIEGNPIRGFR